MIKIVRIYLHIYIFTQILYLDTIENIWQIFSAR